MVRTVAARLILAEMANGQWSFMQQINKLKVSQLWVKASPSLNVRKIVNVIRNKAIELLMERVESVEHAS